jgi:hypothetical protein
LGSSEGFVTSYTIKQMALTYLLSLAGFRSCVNQSPAMTRLADKPDRHAPAISTPADVANPL